MSTPTVSGLVGLILSKNPNFTQDEVLTIIRSTTDSVNYTAHYIGTGRINAYKAIQRDSTPIANLNSDLDDIFIYDEIKINGTAGGSTFVEYFVAYGAGIYPDSMTVIEASSTPVTNDVLTVWTPPTDLEKEYCTIRLWVYDTEERISEDIIVLKVNRAPFAPKIEGTEKIKPGIEYEYKFQTTDLNGDNIEYFVDWGDNTSEDWFGPYISGESFILRHKYNESGKFIIKAKAKDIYGVEGEWGELEVSTPRNKITYNILFLQLFERFSDILSIILKTLGF